MISRYFLDSVPPSFRLASDIKKVVQWYNILQKNDLLNTIEEEETADISEEE